MLKTLPFLLVMLIVSQFLYAQKTVENPKHGIMSDGRIHIRKVQMTDSATILSIHTDWFHNQLLEVPKETYIQPVGSSEKLYVTKADSVPIGEKYLVSETGVKEFVLYFPPIDTSTALIDYGEGNQGGSWFVYDIELKKGSFLNPKLDPYIGNWFLTDGSKALIVGLYEKNAVYNSQVWNYGKIKTTDKQIEIELVRLKEKQLIYLTLPDSGICKMGTSTKKMVEVSNTAKEVAGYKNPDDAPYQQPILKNDSATYCGVYRNSNPRFIQKTGLIYVDNIFTGKQESYSVKIADNGAFSITIPLSYPHSAYIRFPFLNGTIFLQPGKTTFHLIDLKEWSFRNLFMGELAQVNADLMALENIRHYDYQKVQDTILSLSPEQFRDYCFKARDLDMNELNQYTETHYVSPKAVQVKSKSIVYNAISNSMEYKWRYEDAYRKKNNIPNDKRNVKIDFPKSDTTLYSFLTNSLVNDPLASISLDYYIFINRIKYLDILRDIVSFSSSYSSIEKLAKEEGITLSPEEEMLIAKGKLIEEDPVFQQKRNAITSKYQSAVKSLNTKNLDLIKEWKKNESFVFYYDIEDSLKARGIEVTTEEKEFLKEMTALKTRSQQLDLLKANKLFQKENGEAANAFFDKYKYLVQDQFQKKTKDARDEKLQQLFKVEKGLASDIMYAQDLCRGIVEEATPMETEVLKKHLNQIKTPFISEYILSQNEQTKAKLEANKLKTGYAVNIAPSVEADKLFDAMLEKFKGKVVFVDFWATWCGPCRSGIERIKPLKEEMAGKNIVFLYITGPSSPEITWNNMIPEISGEHYRVNTDEWNAICGKFNISGIPHYALVDKNGVVAKNNGMPSYDLKAMKAMFEEFMAK